MWFVQVSNHGEGFPARDAPHLMGKSEEPPARPSLLGPPPVIPFLEETPASPEPPRGGEPFPARRGEKFPPRNEEQPQPRKESGEFPPRREREDFPPRRNSHEDLIPRRGPLSDTARSPLLEDPAPPRFPVRESSIGRHITSEPSHKQGPPSRAESPECHSPIFQTSEAAPPFSRAPDSIPRFSRAPPTDRVLPPEIEAEMEEGEIPSWERTPSDQFRDSTPPRKHHHSSEKRSKSSKSKKKSRSRSERSERSERNHSPGRQSSDYSRHSGRSTPRRFSPEPPSMTDEERHALLKRIALLGSR